MLVALRAAKRLVKNPFDEDAQHRLANNTTPIQGQCVTKCESCPLRTSTVVYPFCMPGTVERIRNAHMEGLFVLRLLEFIGMIEAQLGENKSQKYQETGS
jgi:hypothetical protein